MYRESAKNRLYWAVQFLLLTAFLLLCYAVSEDHTLAIDRSVAEGVQRFQSPWLDRFFEIFHWFGFAPQSVLMVILTAVVFFLLRLKRDSFYILLTLPIGLFSHFLKAWVDRPRPTSELVRIIDQALSQSFPSGHVLLYLVFFGFLNSILYRRRLLPPVLNKICITLFWGIILLIPYSRMYMGAHWFTDVLGSLLLGTVYLAVLNYFYFNSNREARS